MKRIQTLHKALSMLLTAAMVLNMGLTPVFAAEGATTPGISGVCTHHTEHTADCGYQQGAPCTHEHTEDCSIAELTCTLTEGDTAGDAPEIATDSEATLDSGHAPAGETHTHGEDCYTKTDNCKHEHDEACGYTPDTACSFDPASCTECKPVNQPIEKVCTCPPVDSGELVHGKDCPLYTAHELSEAVQALIALVDALHDTDAITEENRETVKTTFDTALTAYDALTVEDKATFETTEQYKKLMALHGVLYAMMPMAAGDKVEVWRNGELFATYADLNKALGSRDIKSGDTVKLLDDFRTTKSLEINALNSNITLDLNDKTISIGHTGLVFSVEETRTLDVKNGKITYTNQGESSVSCDVFTGGNINIENVDMLLDAGSASNISITGLYAKGGTINATNCRIIVSSTNPYSKIDGSSGTAIAGKGGKINIIGGEYYSFMGIYAYENSTISLAAQPNKHLRITTIMEPHTVGNVKIASGTTLLHSRKIGTFGVENQYALTSSLKTFSGRVSEIENSINYGIVATITATDEKGNEVFSTSSDDVGEFSASLLPGTYDIKITSAQHVELTDKITVTDKDISKNYTPVKLNRIFVRATSNGVDLSSVTVTASKDGKNYISEQKSNPYIIYVPVAGTYSVSVSLKGYTAPEAQTVTFNTANTEKQDLTFELTDAREYIYDIFTKGDLISFSRSVNSGLSYSGKTVNLRANIDMRNVAFTPISYFRGTFEGGGFTISNLHISGDGLYVGFFGQILGATIRNLGLVNCEVVSDSSNTNVGAISGFSENSNFENCYVTGTMTGGAHKDTYIGGITGLANFKFNGSQNTIINCYSTIALRSGKVSGRDTQLAAVEQDSKLTNSYYTENKFGYHSVSGLGKITSVEHIVDPAIMATKLNTNIATAGKEGVWVPWVQSGTSYPTFGDPEFSCKIGEMKFKTLSSAVEFAFSSENTAFITMIADETLNAPITIPTGKSLTLLAEGDCTISRGTAAAAGDRMFIISGTGTSLTLGAAGGMGNGNNLTFDGIGTAASDTFFGVLNGASFSMYDGVKITGMARTGDGNAAAIYANGTSVLNIAGGEISGNSIESIGDATAAGIYMNAATLNLTSGKIINNTGSGIGFANANTTVNLSGNPVVKDNILSDGKTARNLYLRNVANVKGALAGGASIGVSHITSPTEATPRPFAQGSGYALSDTDLTRFTSDVNGFELRKNASDQFELFVNVQYILTVTGGTGGGQYSEGETVTITADAPSSGKQFKEWTVTPTVTFTAGTSKTDSTAKFTMPNGAVTAEATYEGIPAGHTHAWATAWTTDTAHHWHECTAGNCTISENSGKDGYAAHAGTWTTDATNHSKICTICSYVMVASTAHVYDDATDTTCNTCGYVRTIAATITGVSVSPATANVQKGTTQSFSATVSGTGAFDSTVTWSVNGGAGTSVSASGVLTVAAGETASTLTVTATANGDNSKKGTATVTLTSVPVTKYLVTVNGGTGGGQYSEGETITVMADAPSSGKQFKEWTVSPTVTFTAGTSKTDSTAKFTMPNGAVSAEATYEDIPAGHTHAWATAWTTDTAHHWHECAAGNCTVSENSGKDGYAAHAGTWTTDATNHSKICTICSYVMVASTAHVYDDATDTTCNTCGYVRTIAATITGVSVSPTTANVQKGTTQSFSATVSGTGAFDSTVTWSVNGGAGTSVSASGVLTVAAGETANTLTVTATASADTNKKGTATVTVTSAAVTKYLVTVGGGTGGAEYEQGNTVTITATVPTSKQFKTWTVNSGGITLVNANSSTTTFTMPANAVTVTASLEDAPHTHSYTGRWQYNGSQHWQLCTCGDKGNYASHSGNPCTICGYSYSSGGGSGSTGGGGTTTNDNTITTQPSKPSENNPNPSTEGIIKPPVSVDKDGTVNAPVTDKDIQNAIDKAVEQARKNGTSANGIAITIDLTGLKTEFNTLPLTLSKSAYQKLVNAEVKSISIRTPQISLALDLETLKTLLSNATGDVTINAAKVDKTKLTAAAQKELGNRPTYDLTIKSGGKLIGSFGKGNISITLPYTLATGERAGALALAYVDSAGKVQTITQSSYDANSKSLIGRTNHFTVFGIVSKPAPTFTDIKGHWAEQDILFVATRGLLSGTSTTAFFPNTSMTRGMFVTALGRLAGIDSTKYKNTKFTDVAATAYYAPYVAWAAEKNITSGTSDTTFSPDKAITRQEMEVMLVNYSKAIGYKLPSVHAEVTFTDAGSIGAWAKDAVKQTQMAGILMGKSGNRFDPTATATRAEVSAMLRRYVELVVNTETAEGWAMNESGQWLYIENGKRVTGNKTIDGKSYTFDQFGTTTALPPERKYLLYTVQAGDSFWAIARKYKVSMFELAKANGKTIFSVIYAGEELKIPQK